MAKANRYHTHIEPNMEAIAAYARAGYTDKDIAKILGVALSTFRRYRAEHEELSQAMRGAKDLADKQIENSAFLSAKGHKVTLKKPFKLRRREYDKKTGKLALEEEVIEYADEETYIPPVPTAFMFWLCNRAGDEWKYQSRIGIDSGDIREIKVVYEKTDGKDDKS